MDVADGNRSGLRQSGARADLSIFWDRDGDLIVFKLIFEAFDLWKGSINP